MAVRSGHGRGAGRPHPEVLPPDELPAPVAALADRPARRQNGQFTAESARQAGRAGGLAKARRSPVKAAQALGLGRALEGFAKAAQVEPFIDAGERWMKQALEGLARDVGGGELSAEVVSIVSSAAWQKIFSDFLFDLSTRSTFLWDVERAVDGTNRPRVSTEAIALASRLAEAHRQSMLAAFELAAREGKARVAMRAQQPYDVGAALGLPEKT